MCFHQGPSKEPRDCRVLGRTGLMGWGWGWGWGGPGSPLERAGSPLPLSPNLIPHFRPRLPLLQHPPTLALLISTMHQGGGDPCVPTGSRGRRRRTARCWGSASLQAPWWRWPWVPCTMTQSTGHTPRCLTLRGEHCPIERAPEACECQGTGGGWLRGDTDSVNV